jgi:KDO2-lipid IV(A) lauroyltransferase
VSSLRHKVEHGGIAVIRGLVGVLPPSVVRALGAGLGLMFYAVDRVHRNVAMTNLATAFPQRTVAERRRICRAMFVHFGRVLFELLRFSTLSPEGMRRLIEFDGEERVVAAFAQGKGVLFFTGHFGHWEVQAIGHGLVHPPVGVLARALDNPMLNELLEQIRGKTGNFVIYRQGRRAQGAARAGRRPGRGNVDRSAHEQPGRHLRGLLRATRRDDVDARGAGAAHRRAGGPRLCASDAGGTLSPDLRARGPPPDQDSPDAIREFTQRCTDVLEMYVRRHPSLWLWMHRRWRDAPLPESTPGMFPHARADAGAAEE